MRSLFSRKSSASSDPNSGNSICVTTHESVQVSSGKPPKSHQSHSIRSRPIPKLSFNRLPPLPSEDLPLPPSPLDSALPHKHQRSHSGRLQPLIQIDHEENLKCPVCLEDLRMKLETERGLVLPSCGHRLHESCFEAVYGLLATARRTGNVLGLCGVCRKDMVIDAKGSKQPPIPLRHSSTHPFPSKGHQPSAKFAAMAGLSVASSPSRLRVVSPSRKTDPHASRDNVDDDDDDEDLFGFGICRRQGPSSADPARSEPPFVAHNSQSAYEQDDSPADRWDTDDDLLPIFEHPQGSIRALYPSVTMPLALQQRPVAEPVIRAISECSVLTHDSESGPNQHFTCLVSFELPTQCPFRSRSFTTPIFDQLTASPTTASSSSIYRQNSIGSNLTYSLSPASASQLIPTAVHPMSRSGSCSSSSPASLPHYPLPSPHAALSHPPTHHILTSATTHQHFINPFPASPLPSTPLPPPPSAPPNSTNDSSDDPANQIPLTLPGSSQSQTVLESIHLGLLDRIQDWKGHSPRDFGQIRAERKLVVEKDRNKREFLVYLYDEALLCVSEDKHSVSVKADGSRQPKLKLKGRVYVRHMKEVTIRNDDTEKDCTQGPTTLEVRMEDIDLDVFVMKFDNQTECEDWRLMIQGLIERKHSKRKATTKPAPPSSQTSLPAAQPHVQLSQSHSDSQPHVNYYPPDVVARSSPTSPSKRHTSCSPSAGSLSQGNPSPTHHSNSDTGDGVSLALTGSIKTGTFTSATTLFSVGEEDIHWKPSSNPPLSPTTSPTTSHPQLLPSLGIRKMNSAHQDAQHYFLSERQHQQFLLERQRHEEEATDSALRMLPYLNPNLNQITWSPTNNEPIDLMLILSIPNPKVDPMTPNPNRLKAKLLKESLLFLVHHLHPRSRVSIVIYTVGVKVEEAVNLRSGQGAVNTSNENMKAPIESNCRLKSTPFLSIGCPTSFERLKYVIECCVGDRQMPSETRQHPFEAPQLDYSKCLMIDRDEPKVSVTAAVNLALDRILQRQQKNSLTGILVLNDGKDLSTKMDMSLVMTRAEVASIPIQTIGWGRAHSPASLWQLSNHTGGSYTLVKDWYSIKEAIAGCVGGMLSVGTCSTRLRISVPEQRWFRMKKLSGVTNSVLAASGHHAEIELGEMRFGERRDVLVEMEMTTRPGDFKAESELMDRREQRRHHQRAGTDHTLPGAREEGHDSIKADRTGTDEFFLSQMGGLRLRKEIMGIEDAHLNLMESEFEQMNEDIPLLEVDVSYRDPRTRKDVMRLKKPVTLSITVIQSCHSLSSTNSNTGLLSITDGEAALIVRRRIELLTSDSLSRAILLVTKRMDRQAMRLLMETRTITLRLMRNLYSIDLFDRSRSFSNSSSMACNLDSRPKGGEAEDEDDLSRANNNQTDHSPGSGHRVVKRQTFDLEGLLVLGGCWEVTESVLDALRDIETGLREIERRFTGNAPRVVRARELGTKQVYQKFEFEMRSWIGEQSGILRDQRASLISEAEKGEAPWTGTRSGVGHHFNEEAKGMMRDELIRLWLIGGNCQTNQQTNSGSSWKLPELIENEAVLPDKTSIRGIEKDKRKQRYMSRLEKVYFNCDESIRMTNMIKNWSTNS